MSLKTSRAFQFLTSIRFRLTALFVCIFGSTLVLFSTLLYQVFARNHMREFDAALYNYTVDVANGIQVNFLGDLRFRPNIPFDEKKAFPFSVGQSFFQITDVNGIVLLRRSIRVKRIGLEKPKEQVRSMNPLKASKRAARGG